MVPVAPVVTGITYFTLHIRCISILLSPEIVMFINRHIPFSFSRIMTSGLLLGMFLSVVIFLSLIRLPYFNDLFLLTLAHSYTRILVSFYSHVRVHVKCSWVHTLSQALSTHSSRTTCCPRHSLMLSLEIFESRKRLLTLSLATPNEFWKFMSCLFVES
jgi:hypothetical protein